MTFRHYWVSISLLVALHAGVSAQSLADVATAEAARRKTVKSTGKVYTNESLGETPATSPAPSSAKAPEGRPSAATAPEGKPADAAAKPEEKKAVDPAKTEKYWKDRAATIQQSLSRSKLLLEALQTQVSGMNAEFMNTDDPGQRDLLQARLQRSTGELQRVQQDIEKQTKAAVDLQEEARKAGAPAGWVR
jgi:hypothetical protein